MNDGSKIDVLSERESGPPGSPQAPLPAEHVDSLADGPLAMNTKTCSKCRMEFPATTAAEFFPPDKRKRDGFSSWCRKCHRTNITRWRAAHPEASRTSVARWKAAHPGAAKARKAAYRAIRAGRLTYPDACEWCGKPTHRFDKHHPDYARPLDVVFLCRRCHKKVHLELAALPAGQVWA